MHVPSEVQVRLPLHSPQDRPQAGSAPHTRAPHWGWQEVSTHWPSTLQAKFWGQRPQDLPQIGSFPQTRAPHWGSQSRAMRQSVVSVPNAQYSGSSHSLSLADAQLSSPQSVVSVPSAQYSGSSHSPSSAYWQVSGLLIGSLPPQPATNIAAHKGAHHCLCNIS